MSDRKPRGRIAPPPAPKAPNAEPAFLPELPKKLEFGTHVVCPWCKGKGRKGGKICGACGGVGVVSDPH